MRRGTVRAPGLPALPGLDALGNWSAIAQTPTAQTQTAAGVIPVLAVALRIKYSGIVRIDSNIYFGGSANTEVISLSTVLTAFAPPVATPIFAASGSGVPSALGVAASRDTAQDVSTPLAWGAALESDAHGNAANTFTFNGGLVTGGQALATQVEVAVTGQLTVSRPHVFSGLVFNYGAAATPITGKRFARDTYVVAAIVLTTNTDTFVVNWNGGSITIQEMPL